MLTTTPGPRLAAVTEHRRLAVLGDEDVDRWLSPDTGPRELAALARLGGRRDYRIRAADSRWTTRATTGRGCWPWPGRDPGGGLIQRVGTSGRGVGRSPGGSED